MSGVLRVGSLIPGDRMAGGLLHCLGLGIHNAGFWMEVPLMFPSLQRLDVYRHLPKALPPV